MPSVYMVVITDRGNHIFADKQLSGCFRAHDLLADSSALANGLVNASGDINAIEISDRLINPGILSRSIQPKTRDVINSLTNKEKQNITIEFDNHDYKLSQNIVKDPWLTKIIMVYAGFEADTLAEQVLLFTGRIMELEVQKVNLLVYAEEL